LGLDSFAFLGKFQGMRRTGATPLVKIALVGSDRRCSDGSEIRTDARCVLHFQFSLQPEVFQSKNRRMSDQPQSVRFPCPLCGGNLEVAADDVGRFAPCPHCGQEIPLEKPVKEDFVIQSSKVAQYHQARNRTAHAAATGTTTEIKELAKVGYLLAIVIPLVGFFFGFYLMLKNCPTEGVVCMVLSVFSSAVWAIVLFNFL
jgi:predicted RNA-binding Zn-ribbon protein involved in translation (DUF1610 family)